jgi:hypothetical protein
MSSYEQRRNERQRLARTGVRRERSEQRGGRSIYENRPEREPQWTPVADTNPLTGRLEWAPGWARLPTGCQRLDEFLMRRDR